MALTRSARAATAGAIGLLVVAAIALHQGAQPPGDRSAMGELHELSRPTLDSVVLWITKLGSAPLIVGLAVALAGWFAVRRRWSPALFVLVSVGGAGVATALIKRLVERTRPDVFPWLTPESGYSFPSGHSTGAMALALAVTVLVWHRRGGRLVAALAVGTAVLVGISRIYVGVHYPTDVLAGWTVAAVVVGLSFSAWRRWGRPPAA